MGNVASAIRDTVPISLFNRGLAGKVFDEVKKTGAKAVMKNNAAECVLMPPEEYVAIMDELEDARLLAMATEHTAADPATYIGRDDLWAEMGVTDGDVAGVPDVEFE
ncbi:hypothetical protein [Curtanaerobium respiraculi]|uniref:hypothetical protein n=1 Tax=Curtanaerobium respiraculi TaxID=2949669 RepID=UPI0024B39CBF|nr:hypothetical protein [Curtanaerobium respiraculi]